MNPTTSAARIAANQANAALSTGPNTKGGKERSRGNAVKHGLTARVVGLDGIEPVPAGDDAGAVSLDPVWLANHCERTMAQIDRATRIEGELRAEAAFRASTIWETDQAVQAETLGRQLIRQPSATVAKLQQTAAGCAWLIARWALLRHAATSNDGWNAPQTELAFNLLGIPAEFRDLTVGAAVALRHLHITPALSNHEIAEQMLAELQKQQAIATQTDALNRRLTQADSVDLPTPALARLRRYDSALRKQLRWLMDQLQVAQAAAVALGSAGLQNEPSVTETKPTSTTSGDETTPPEPVLTGSNHPKPTETTPMSRLDAHNSLHLTNTA